MALPEEKIWSKTHASQILKHLEKDVFPFIGSHLVGDITTQELLVELKRIEARSPEIARKVKIASGQVFKYAIVTGKIGNDPTAALRGALTSVQNKRMAAPILHPIGVTSLLCVIYSYSGTFVVQCALKLAPLLFVRPGELRKAEWAEIDLEKEEWRIPIHITTRLFLFRAANH